MVPVDPVALGTPPKELRAGRYVLLAPLGQGSQGTTWDAVDKREGRPVAVKAFDIRGARAWKDVELAEREARVLSELHHPGLPRYVEHFEEEGVLYLVMEKVHGTPLSVLQKRGPRMNDKELTRLLHDADQVLGYLHGRNPPVVHRDIKPSNVLRRTDGSYAFVDFGAVRDHLRPEGGSTVVGTFGYMAPEQFQGRAGPGSDVYAVGATAIAMLTGREPEKLPHKGLALDVRSALAGSVNASLENALTKMLEPDPDQRATRIGPLLDGVPRRRSSAEERVAHPAANWVASAERGARAGNDVRREVRRAVKEARRQARHARRAAQPFRLPFVIRILFGAGLTLAQIVVTLALHVFVPVVLTILSLLFGDSLRRAARYVQTAGSQAGDALRDAREQVRRGWGTPEDFRGRARDARRTPSPAEGRVRVSAPPREAPRGDHEHDLEEEYDADDEREPDPKRRRQL